MARQLSKVIGKSRALVKLPELGRQLAKRIPEPVQIRLGKASRRTAIITLEFFAGLLVLGAVAMALIYGRVNQGPISLSFLVPTIEQAINRELADLTVKIDDFTMQRVPDGPGMSFRLRNIRLVDTGGAVVAQAPSAAIGLSGSALLWGDIAPGSVDFIGPRLLLFHTPESGLSLTFSRSAPEPSGSGNLRGTLDFGPERNAGAGQKGAPRPVEPGIALIAPSKQINLTRTLTAVFERARSGETATSYLTRFGVRDAIVVFDQNGQQSFWQVPDFAIDLEHRQKRSIILGEANISSATGPWRLNFRTEQSQKQQSLTFTALIRDLVPTGVAANFPAIPVLKALKLPLDAETSIHLTTDGELVDAEAKLRLSAGHIVAPWDHKHPMLVDDGDLHVRYRARDNRIDILPSTVQWGQSRATISGEFVPEAEGGEIARWSFRVTGDKSVLAADEFGVAPLNVDRWEAKGTYLPKARRVDLDSFILQIGDALIELAGTVVDAPGSPAVKLAGRFSAMPLSMLKRMWPKFIAAGAREWIGERVTAGHLSGGAIVIDVPAGMLAGLEKGGDVPDNALRMVAGASSLEIHYIKGLPPVQTGQATLRIDGRKFAMDVPRGWITLPSGKRIALDTGTFRIDDLRPDPQHGVIDFRMKGSAGAVLELLDHKPLEYVKSVGLKPSGLKGRSEGNFTIRLPLVKDVEFADIRLKGAAQLNEASLSQAFGKFAVEGGAVRLNVTEQALEARGDILLNGIPAQLSWQRIFGAPPEKQPELRVMTVLDENARKQLGLDVNHMIRGPASVILGLRTGSDGKPATRVRANLTDADLILSNVGWRKPPGRSAILTFDIGEGAQGNTELQNFKVEGPEIGIEGWIALGPDDEPSSFYFPQFSFNVITRMEIAGEKRSDGIWDVQAQGAAYDGRQFFQSLFSAGQLVEDPPPSPEEGGVNLTANIGAIAGFFDTTVNDVSISLQKRNGRLTALDASGKLNGRAPIAVRLVADEGQPRVVLAESEDAGAAFRLVGFYPRIEDGQASLQVNLDAAGPATKAGILWAKDFNVLGDRVVSEVLASSGDDPFASFGQTLSQPPKIKRQRIAFDQLRVPFSVGGGRFELHDSYINGPKLGATVRGYVDFKTEQMEIGGTYIPAYGLNSALGSIPVIGSLLVGRRGEGVLGITFAIKGSATEPQVVVNPVSMVAPGILRQIFEYTGRSPESFPDHSRPQPGQQSKHEGYVVGR